MAQGWMSTKLLKMKRDGMRDTRGTFERFRDEPSKHTPRIHPGDGWYIYLKGVTPRGLPATYGPFKGETEARAFAKRSNVTDYSIREHVTVKRSDAPGDVTFEVIRELAAEYVAKQAAALELRKAEREALGRRTKFAWQR
jgi:hypothetical protein